MTWVPAADLNYAQKQAVLAGYAERFPLGVMVETGLYGGRGSGLALGFARYIAIDLMPANCEALAAAAPGAEVACCDSGVWMPVVLAGVDEPAFFWLDAHSWDEGSGGDPRSPVLAELAAILAWPHHRASVVLIDDVRIMGTEGWPSLSQVLDLAEATWKVEVMDDVLRLTPWPS